MKIKVKIAKFGDLYYLHVYHLEERYKYDVNVDNMWICGREQKYLTLSCFEDISYDEGGDINWLMLDRISVDVPFEVKDYTRFDGGRDKEEQKFVFIPTKQTYGNVVVSEENFIVEFNG